MNIPRTYLAEVATAALAKVGKTETHQVSISPGISEVQAVGLDQAIVDVQGVINLVHHGDSSSDGFEQAIADLRKASDSMETNLITTDFERAAVEALAEMPLNAWLVEWRKATKDSNKARANSGESN
jgi:hypothetical protein